MEKKELPNNNIEADLQPKQSAIGSKISGFASQFFSLIKLALGLSLLPFVYSATIVFAAEFGLVNKSCQGYFWSGLITLAIIYLFVWEPAIIYAKGQKILEFIFGFFKPLVRVAPYLLPIYTIIIFSLYGLLSLAIQSKWLIYYSLFLAGFTISLHLIFSAKALRSKKNAFLKANYIFGFSVIYIINVLILAFCINLILKEFSFVNFFNNTFSLGRNIFYAVFKQLFLR